MDDQLGFELEWADPRVIVHMHPRCYGILHANWFVTDERRVTITAVRSRRQQSPSTSLTARDSAETLA